MHRILGARSASSYLIAARESMEKKHAILFVGFVIVFLSEASGFFGPGLE